jgi:hypothetical protein
VNNPVEVKLPQQHFLSLVVHELFWHIHCAVFKGTGDSQHGENRYKWRGQIIFPAEDHRLAITHILANLLKRRIQLYIRRNFGSILAPLIHVARTARSKCRMLNPYE